MAASAAGARFGPGGKDENGAAETDLSSKRQNRSG